MKRFIIASLLVFGSVPCLAQNLPDKPVSKKKLVMVNMVNFAASGFLARANWYGAHRCVVFEHDFHASPAAKMRRSLEISLPLGTAVALLSWKWRKKHPTVAIALPLISASGQIGAGSVLQSAGCL